MYSLMFLLLCFCNDIRIFYTFRFYLFVFVLTAEYGVFLKGFSYYLMASLKTVGCLQRV